MKTILACAIALLVGCGDDGGQPSTVTLDVVYPTGRHDTSGIAVAPGNVGSVSVSPFELYYVVWTISGGEISTTTTDGQAITFIPYQGDCVIFARYMEVAPCRSIQ